MNLVGGIVLILLIGGGIAFATIGIRKTLEDKTGSTRKTRRHR